jgi:capsular polysaccharide export protein
LIESSQFVVTLNSTVGLESLLLGKPVLTLGQAFFNIEGLVVHADSADEMIRLAKAFPDWPLDARLRQNFLHYMIHEYCIEGGWSNADLKQLERVANRMLREFRDEG